MVRWCPNLGTFNSKNEEILAICCVDKWGQRELPRQAKAPREALLINNLYKRITGKL